jgi:polyisoprenoid-binding protein YceI
LRAVAIAARRTTAALGQRIEGSKTEETDMQRTSRLTRTATVTAVLLALFVLAPVAGAAEQVLSLDPDASEVTFLVDATGHDVHGTLYLNAGEVHFDPATGTASGRIEIDATRAETGNRSRDKTMHKKVLESVSFPLFVFVPDHFTGEIADAGSSRVELHGTLTIHGAEHPLTLEAAVERGEDGALTAVSSFDVPYVEWGMHNPSLLFLRVADRVAVTVKAAGALHPPGATSAAMETAAAGSHAAASGH